MTDISDAQFWNILRANAGMFATTAHAIAEKIGKTYTRQSVRERALRDPEKLEDIREQSVDDAEGVVFKLLKNWDPRVKLKAAETILRARARDRGYGKNPPAPIGPQDQTAPIVLFGDVDERKPK